MNGGLHFRVTYHLYIMYMCNSDKLNNSKDRYMYTCSIDDSHLFVFVDVMCMNEDTWHSYVYRF